MTNPAVTSEVLRSTWQFTDEKGRGVTGYVVIVPPGSTTHYRDTADKFEVFVRAERNGQTFGAIPRRTHYLTVESARAAAATKLEEQRKRYAKKYPGTEALSAHGIEVKAAASAAAKRATTPKASTAKPSSVAKLDAAAVQTLRKVGTTVGAFQGIVSADTMKWINEHAALLCAEVIKPTLGLDAPEVIVSVEPDRKGRLGHYKPGRDGLGLSWRVVLNLRYLARPRAQVISTLLHEILHAAQERSGKPGKGNHHNKQFQTWCEQVGIPTDAKGHDRGVTEGGPFDLYAKRHKLEGSIPLIAKKDAPKSPGSKNKKWTCGCGVNVRCAVELNATCGECETPFVLQEK